VKSGCRWIQEKVALLGRFCANTSASTLRDTARNSALSSHFSPLSSTLPSKRRLACEDQADILIPALDGNALLRNYASIVE